MNKKKTTTLLFVISAIFLIQIVSVNSMQNNGNQDGRFELNTSTIPGPIEGLTATVISRTHIDLEWIPIDTSGFDPETVFLGYSVYRDGYPCCDDLMEMLDSAGFREGLNTIPSRKDIVCPTQTVSFTMHPVSINKTTT